MRWVAWSVLLLAAAVLAGCAQGGGSYHGGVLDASFDEPWDADHVRSSILSIGGNVSDLRDAPDAPGSYYLGEASFGGSAVVFVAEPDAPGRWSMRATFDSESGVFFERRADAQAHFEEERGPWEEAFKERLRSFEQATGWRHATLEWSMRFGH
ncbi:MAG: hypothetical protein ACPGQL_09650 [Thermoplasmatota archaeon]